MKNNSFISSLLRNDLPSGLVVFLVALPLCLGIALASTGRPDLIFSGIISGIIGGIVVGFLSGSSLGVSGPAAGLVVIVVTAIESLQSYEAFLLAVVLSGLIQLIAGFLRLGIVGHYFPSSVIKGMLTAIGIILILKEIPHFLGYDEDFMGDLNLDESNGHNTFSELYYAFKNSHLGATLIATISLGVLILFETKFIKKIGLFKFLPGALFVIFIGVLVNYLFSIYFPMLALSGKHLVQLPEAGSAKEFISFFATPDFSAIKNIKVYEIAFTLAIVASLESLLSVEATDKLDPLKRRTSTNRELKAQGVGNILSGLIGGLPITQVIVRSSANINSGGKTKAGTIIHGFILLIAVIFIPAFLNLIPLPCLAAILLLIGYKLAKPKLFIDMYHLKWEQFIPFVITVVVIVLSDLLKGIAIGVFFAIFYILRDNYRISSILCSDGNNYVITLSEEVSFLNKANIAKKLSEIPDDSKLTIDGQKSIKISYDVKESILEFINYTSKIKNIKTTVKGINLKTSY